MGLTLAKIFGPSQLPLVLLLTQINAYAVFARARVCLNLGFRSGYSLLFFSVYPQFPHSHAPVSCWSNGRGFAVRWRSVRGHIGTVI